MEKHKPIGINALLNVIRTVLALVAPLITYPYVSRILGAENLGCVNYTNSIIQYFVLISGLGISTYGIREGAKKRGDIQQLNQFISQCFSINIICTFVTYFIFAVFLWMNRRQDSYLDLFIVQSFLILFNTIGIDWVNTVFEDYFFITIRTIIVQIISIIFTFAFIHKREDYLCYAIITITTTGIVSILNWFHYRKLLDIRIVFNSKMLIHLKPIVVFFANKLAVTLYVSADITMLGAMVGEYSVGIYSISVKLYNIVKTILGAIYSVFLPRLAFTLGQKNMRQFKKIYSDLISIMSLVIFPASVGLFVLSKNIILFMFGNEYASSSISLSILSIAIVFSIMGGLVSSVYDVVMGLEKIALKATILAATFNIGINFVLLPYLHEVGAAITTVLAEAVTFIYCMKKSKGIKENINVLAVRRNALHSLLGCIEIVIVVSIVQVLFESHIIILAVSFILSIVLYAFILIILKNPFAMVIISKFRKIIEGK